MESTCFPPIESLPRIGVKELCDNFDSILDKVEKENTAYVIVDENGKEAVVLCPIHCFNFKYELEQEMKEREPNDLCNV